MKILDYEPAPFHELEYRTSGPGGVERRTGLPFNRAWVDALPTGINSLVAVSDIQGRELDRERNRLVGEAVAEELSLLEEFSEIPQIGGVLLSGDLYDYPDCNKLGGTGDVTAVWNAFASIAPAVFGVHGNHDTIEQDLPTNAMVLDGQIEEFADLRIGGVSGIIGREDRHHRRSEARSVSSSRVCWPRRRKSCYCIKVLTIRPRTSLERRQCGRFWSATDPP